MDSLLGIAGAFGRVNPLILEEAPKLESLIAELPFGTPHGEPPARGRAPGVLDGVSMDAPILYFGGIYDWYDPEIVLRALPAIIEHEPGVVVVFVDHPHPEETPLSAAAATRRMAEENGWLGSSVRFEGWRPYERRFELALAADLAVVTHRPGLETDLSLRTRMVDLLWLGLPVVATRGGAMSGIVEAVGAGRTVAPGDSAELAAAVSALLADSDERRRAGEAGRRWARGRCWEHVARPLLDFAAAPRRDPHRDRFVELAPSASSAEEPLLRRAERTLKRWFGR